MLVTSHSLLIVAIKSAAADDVTGQSRLLGFCSRRCRLDGERSKRPRGTDSGAAAARVSDGNLTISNQAAEAASVPGCDIGERRSQRRCPECRRRLAPPTIASPLARSLSGTYEGIDAELRVAGNEERLSTVAHRHDRRSAGGFPSGCEIEATRLVFG